MNKLVQSAPSLTLPRERGRESERRLSSAFLEKGTKAYSAPALRGRAGEGADILFSKLSDRTLFGLKGPNAATWLEAQSVSIPARANSWLPLRGDELDLILRLGTTEFLIDQEANTQLGPEFESVAACAIDGVYPVLREDACFQLAGAYVQDVLSQVCNVNFAEWPFEERHAVMTMMIGVAVTVVPQGNAAQPRYRVWCDPSFGDYLGGSLQQIVNESSGGWREHQNSG